MWSFSFITHDWGGGELLIPQILRGFPQVFAVAPAVTFGLGSLPPERLKYASGLFNMMRNLGGAVGIAVCGAILNDQDQFPFRCDRLASDAGERRDAAADRWPRTALCARSRAVSMRATSPL